MRWHWERKDHHVHQLSCDMGCFGSRFQCFFVHACYALQIFVAVRKNRAKKEGHRKTGALIGMKV
jgi:hypothetical protein